MCRTLVHQLSVGDSCCHSLPLHLHSSLFVMPPRRGSKKQASAKDAARRRRTGAASPQASSPAGGYWRKICFTLNNPHMSKEALLESLQSHPAFGYCVAGVERGDSGKRHFQGYLVMKAAVRTNVTNRLLPGSHCEARRGSAKEADLYCQKGEWLGPNFGRNADFITGGVRSRDQGCRTDLERCRGSDSDRSQTATGGSGAS